MKKIYSLLTALSLLTGIATAQVGVDRSKRPPAGPPPVITIKDPVIFKLPNGTTVLVVEDHRFQKVTANLNIDWGVATEGSKAGVISLMGAMLNEGTKDLTKAQFDEAVDKLGANVGLSSTGGTASALTRYFPQALELLGKAIKTPAFTQESFDKLKSQALTGIKSNEKNVKAISARIVNAVSYGKGHPMGEFQTEQTLQNITLADVTGWYKKLITPSRAYLTIVGDIKPEEARHLTEKFFSDWKGAPYTLPVLTAVANPAKTEIDVVDMSNAVQSEITVTNLVDLKMSNPDYFPLLVANQILGGSPSARLFMNLREKHGFTYGSYSNVGAGRFQSKFSAAASVRNAKTDSAVNEILKEIELLRTVKASDEELANAKAIYNGSFALGMENTERTATFARNILVNNLPKDFYRTYLQKINAVTKEDVQRVAQKYFNHANTRVVVVGNTAQMLDGLKKLNHTVKLYDTYGEPVKAGAAAPAVAAKDLFSAYITALGGPAEVAKLKSTSAVMSASVQGMTLNVVQKELAPNLAMMSMTVQGNVVAKSAFNGKGGYNLQMGAKKEMTPEEIKEKADITSLIPQTDYLNNPAFKAEVKGTEKVGGADAYKVLVTYPSGITKTEYYSATSKLLVKSESTDAKTGVTQSMEFGDYRKVGALMMPFLATLTISSNGQSQVIEMKASEVKINEGVTAEDFN